MSKKSKDDIKNLITKLLAENYDCKNVEIKFFLSIEFKDKFEFEDFLLYNTQISLGNYKD